MRHMHSRFTLCNTGIYNDNGNNLTEAESNRTLWSTCGRCIVSSAAPRYVCSTLAAKTDALALLKKLKQRSRVDMHEADVAARKAIEVRRASPAVGAQAGEEYIVAHFQLRQHAAVDNHIRAVAADHSRHTQRTCQLAQLLTAVT